MGLRSFKGFNPATRQEIPQEFAQATVDEIDSACRAAQEAFYEFSLVSGASRAHLLRRIADLIEEAGNNLIEMAMAETGLPEGRLIGERGRTCGQLRMFANIVEEGGYVDAIIDEALPHRVPPRADMRRMLCPVGPIVVFGASNFPLAFSTAGGDTASALAAGCPVIVKGHPSHPGTHALVSDIITQAVADCDLHGGVFSSVQGKSHEVGAALVGHEAIKGVAFTGSLNGGKALMAAAQSRREPIPVFAEMGSINPIVVLPTILSDSQSNVAEQIAASINLGAGQFCTNPGLIILAPSDYQKSFVKLIGEAFAKSAPQTMLNDLIYSSYVSAITKVKTDGNRHIIYSTDGTIKEGCAPPMLAEISAQDFMADELYRHEVFGPYSLIVTCDSWEVLDSLLSELDGQLTGSLFGTASEISAHSRLVRIIEHKVGRIIFNNVPTGVEVCHAMHHGGPYPSTTDSRFTSVGGTALLRFLRPICYQDCPDDLLPDALKYANPLGILRTVNGSKRLG